MGTFKWPSTRFPTQKRTTTSTTTTTTTTKTTTTMTTSTTSEFLTNFNWSSKSPTTQSTTTKSLPTHLWREGLELKYFCYDGAGQERHDIVESHPNHCNHFIYCYNGKHYEIRCKTGLNFNPKFQKCDSNYSCN